MKQYHPDWSDMRCPVDTSALERVRVVVEGRRWVGTPYHHHANVLGSGVDCAQLLSESFFGAGLVDRFDVGKYNHDWHLHRNEEKYLEVVETYCRRIDDTEASLRDRPDLWVAPADILVWRVGRTFSHGALVTEWPYIIHSYFPSNMVEEVSIIGTPMAKRPMRIYSFWGTKE